MSIVEIRIEKDQQPEEIKVHENTFNMDHPLTPNPQFLAPLFTLVGPRERSPSHKNLAVGELQFEAATQVNPS